MVSAADVRAQLAAHRDDLPFPDAVVGWDVKVGQDATGDAAVWVWVVLRDDYMAQAWPMPVRDKTRDLVRELVTRVIDPADVQVYVRFQSESE